MNKALNGWGLWVCRKKLTQYNDIHRVAAEFFAPYFPGPVIASGIGLFGL